MPEWSEEVALELDALQATYGDDLHLDELKGIVSMLLQPSEPQEQAYVQCLLQLTLHSGYPEAAVPSIAFQDAKGLGGGRLAALQALLQQEADGMLREMMLGQLFECGRDWLNDNNWPEGPCIFCLEELCPDGSGSSSSCSQACMRLPCFHAFHKSCFADWWCWQQQALTEQQQQLEQRTGATAAAALAQEQLPCKEGGHFQLTCPSCRTGFSLHQGLQHMLPQLTRQRQQQQQQARSCSSATGASGSSSTSIPGSKLTVAELAPLRDIQRRHAALFAAQQKRQGIIVDASYSITDIPAAAAAAADSSSTVSSGSRGGSSSVSTSSRGSNSRGGISRSSSAVCQQGPPDMAQQSNTSSSRGRLSSRGRGGSGSSSARGAGRGSSQANGGDQDAGRHAVQSIHSDGKYDSRHRSVPTSSRGRGSGTRGRSGRGRGPQQQAGVGVAGS